MHKHVCTESEQTSKSNQTVCHAQGTVILGFIFGFPKQSDF